MLTFISVNISLSYEVLRDLKTLVKGTKNIHICIFKQVYKMINVIKIMKFVLKCTKNRIKSYNYMLKLLCSM